MQATQQHFQGGAWSLIGCDSQGMGLYAKILLCVSGPMRLAIIVDKFKRKQIIQSILSGHSGIKLGINNRRIARKIQKYFDIKYHFKITCESKKKKSQEKKCLNILNT